jgi:hypothetical protein
MRPRSVGTPSLLAAFGGAEYFAQNPASGESRQLSMRPPSDPRAIGTTQASLLMQRLPTADSMPTWLSKRRLTAVS